ncbi:uncharacterized protein FOMMEDRAFT_156452 [Fomitiporia mediterranea MF3/22]|uniref:uncharacterized protein n=1 Tax=Fomitiporia mediterranea (strain MF3/22) TaxID=694068 RepID=UPI000440827F|nr:uncharacterized protein FOMMEDRAFT_156452 [Fomitiporia mediterranea MF3/22]EJD03079.1 hypothetical protein FOMMEDRAFT_156452 [Fomitiporia mediterranea MF3/22]
MVVLRSSYFESGLHAEIGKGENATQWLIIGTRPTNKDPVNCYEIPSAYVDTSTLVFCVP